MSTRRRTPRAVVAAAVVALMLAPGSSAPVGAQDGSGITRTNWEMYLPPEPFLLGPDPANPPPDRPQNLDPQYMSQVAGLIPLPPPGATWLPAPDPSRIAFNGTDLATYLAGPGSGLSEAERNALRSALQHPCVPGTTAPGLQEWTPQTDGRCTTGPLQRNELRLGGPTASRIGGEFPSCRNTKDFTYFRTVLNVPEGANPTQFDVTFGGANDDFVAVFINGELQDSFDPSQGQSQNYVNALRPGRNEVILAQVDDCPTGNVFTEVQVELDGELLPPEVDPTPEPEATPTPEPEATPTPEPEAEATPTPDPEVDEEPDTQSRNRREEAVAPDEPTPTPTPEPEPEERICDPNNPIPVHSGGDVHIKSPDGLVFDFQETGDYVAVQSRDFVVQARQTAWERRPEVSINTGVAMKIGADTVEFSQDPAQSLFVNGMQFDFPTADLTLPGGGTIVVNSSDRKDVYVLLPNGDRAARVILHDNGSIDYGVACASSDGIHAGILGDLDGDPNDDITTRSGQQVTPPATVEQLKVWGDTWRVRPDSSLFRSPDTSQPAAGAPAPAAGASLLTVDDLPDADVAAAESACEASGVTDELAKSFCVYDVAATGDESFVENAMVFQETNAEAPAARLASVAGVAPGDDDDSLAMPLAAAGVVAAMLATAVGVRAVKRR